MGYNKLTRWVSNDGRKSSSKKGDLVADFYMGSGTTAEVCKDLNRNFIGCDISERAVNISRKRITQSQASLF